MGVPDVAALVTLGGAAVVTAMITQLIKRVWQPTPEQADRFLPLVSVLVGIVVVIVASLATGGATAANLVQALVTGLFAGFSASGLYDTISGNTSVGGA